MSHYCYNFFWAEQWYILKSEILINCYPIFANGSKLRNLDEFSTTPEVAKREYKLMKTCYIYMCHFLEEPPDLIEYHKSCLCPRGKIAPHLIYWINFHYVWFCRSINVCLPSVMRIIIKICLKSYEDLKEGVSHDHQWQMMNNRLIKTKILVSKTADSR